MVFGTNQSCTLQYLSAFMSRRKGRWLSVTAMLFGMALFVGLVGMRGVSAQSACAQLGVDCSHHGDNSMPRDTQADEERRRQQAEAREARREQHERDAAAARERKQARDAQKAQEKAQKDQAKRDAAAAKEQQKQAERDRKAAEEAARHQAHGGTHPPIPPQGGPIHQNGNQNGNAWVNGFYDPEVVPIARKLGAVVPPLPIPAKEVSMDWKQVYLNDERLEKTGDLVVAGWEMAGLIEDSSLLVKGLMIGGKGLIGAEDGAYVFLCKRDMIYEAGLHYLKDPKTAKEFAHLVDDLKHDRPIPLGSNPMMVIAAKLIADPHQGSVAWATWDAMSSPEARSAALRKASVEAATDLISAGIGHQTGGWFEDVAQRKAMYESIRVERTAARKMLAEPGVTAARAQELQSVIHKADDLSAWIYKTDPQVKRVKEGFEGLAVGDMCDKFTDAVAGPAAKGREY